MKSIYNENRYLNGDIEVLTIFEKSSEEYEKNKEKSLEENKDLIDNYNIYLDCIVDELLKYNLDSSLDYSVALGYLINKGYLSEDLVFNAKESDKEILGKLGISILLGSGCCRNICDMQEDIFKRLNINIMPYYCFQGFSLFNRGIDMPANHIINIVEYKNNLYGTDLYNRSILYHFKSPFVMKSISSTHDESLRYKPYYELMIDGKKLEDVKKKIEMFNSYSKVKPISYFEYEMCIRNEIEELLFTKQDKLKEFNNKTKVLRKDIINKMNSK